jgi:HAD superfamily hydrolase (TIGR01509 family)
MTLKAVLFDFNGVIINDEPIHQQLIEELLLRENLRPVEGEYQEICLGRSDRVCINDLLMRRGRFVSEDYLAKLIRDKTRDYQQKLAQLDTLPIYPQLEACLDRIKTAGIAIGVVSGALRSEIELVLDRAGLAHYFSAIVAGDDISTSKPEPDGYLLAVERLNRQYPHLQITPGNCLAIEDTPAGIQAGKKAGMQVVAVANTYPFHMMQRQANWCIDYLNDLELERIQEILASAKT